MGLKDKLGKLFMRNSKTGETIPLPDEIPELELSEEEKDTPMPNFKVGCVGGEASFATKAIMDKEELKMITCYGRLPYRKEGCEKCAKVNDCIKAKIADNFNRWR